MADEGKGVALAILGVVAVIAVVGLVLLFLQARVTGKAIEQGGRYDAEAKRLAGSSDFAGDPQLWSQEAVGKSDANYWAHTTSATAARGDLGGRASASHDDQKFEGTQDPKDYRSASGVWQPGAEAVKAAQ